MSDQENQTSRFARDMAANAEKMFKATQLIANTRDEDVAIGTTPKHLMMRRDKVELFHYEPMAEATAKTPVLLAYGLIGRYTMADLQPDRSLVRSLLSKGLDLWLIDWGQPGRTERWLKIDDKSMTTSMPQSTASRRKPAMTRSRCSASAKAASLRRATPLCIRKRSKISSSPLPQSTSMPMSRTRPRTTASSTFGPAASILMTSTSWSILTACCRASS